MDDATLVQQAVAGDRQAFAAIYDRYAPRIHDFLRSLLRDPEEAADALQDTFLVAGARLHQLREPGKLRPWLYAIARHRGLRAIERRRRHRPLDDVEVISAEPDPADAAGDAGDRGELAALVAAAADGLGPRDRVLLDLHMRQGLEGQELGDAVGVSASHAYVLASRLRDQVERSLGALLVARQGREDCPDLALVLAGWDGRFTPVWRKRVARHADGCPVCSDRRSRLLSPAGLLGVAPAVALPAGLRSRVLGELELCSHTGPPFAGGEGGFPPPMPGTGPRRRPAAVAAAAVVLVLLVGGALVAGMVRRGDGPVTEVAVGTATSVPPVSTTTSTTLAGPASTIPATTVGGPATTIPPATASPVDADPPALPGPDATSPTVIEPPATTSTTAPPPDTAPPTLTLPTAVPATVDGCAAGGSRSTTVSVRATDPSGISTVVLEVGGPSPATISMTPRPNQVFSALVGPFTSTPSAPATRIPLTVRATDGAGNVATSEGFFLLECTRRTGP